MELFRPNVFMVVTIQCVFFSASAVQTVVYRGLKYYVEPASYINVRRMCAYV